MKFSENDRRFKGKTIRVPGSERSVREDSGGV